MKILNAREVAETLHISYETALAFLKSGAVSCKKIGHQYLIEESVLEEFFKADGFVDVKLDAVNIYSNFNTSPQKTKLKRRI